MTNRRGRRLQHRRHKARTAVRWNRPNRWLDRRHVLNPATVADLVLAEVAATDAGGVYRQGNIERTLANVLCRELARSVVRRIVSLFVPRGRR